MMAFTTNFRKCCSGLVSLLCAYVISLDSVDDSGGIFYAYAVIFAKGCC
jgi:hypothetical protein